MAKKLSILIILLLSSFQLAMADAVSVAAKQLEDNYNNVVKSLQDLQNHVTSLGDNLKGDGEELINQYKDKLADVMSNVKDADIDGIKNEFKEIKNSVLNLPNDNPIKSELLKFHSEVETTINAVKNVMTVIYTAPVMVRGAKGGAYLELSMDTLRYKREGNQGGIYLDAHALFKLPPGISTSNASSIGFMGENIPLMGGGDPARLHLIGDMVTRRFPIIENRAWMKVSDKSYVEMDCNGIQRVYLKGTFEFASNMILPANVTNLDNDTVVAADFECNVNAKDLGDIVFLVNFPKPFKVKATDNMVYTVSDAIADFSTVTNAENFSFPDKYQNPFKDDPNMWTGFALKALKVDVNGVVPFVNYISAYNVLIDETGVSGWFSTSISTNNRGNKNNSQAGNNSTSAKDNGDAVTDATKVDPGISESGAKVLGVEITELSVGLANGRVCGGSLKGSVDVKPLVDTNGKPLHTDILGTLGRSESGGLEFDIEAKFPVTQKFNMKVCKNMNVTVGAGTMLRYMNHGAQKGFTFLLNGAVSVEKGDVTMVDIGFQDLKFSTYQPHFGGGHFSLNSMKPLEMGGLQISLTKFEAGYDTTSKLAKLEADVAVKLLGGGDNGDEERVSVEGGFTMLSNVEKNWKMEEIDIHKIAFSCDFSAFKMAGSIENYKNDQIFGKGFAGAVSLDIIPINVGVSIAAKFGKTNYKSPNQETYRYWYAAGDARLPGILIFPPSVMLNSISVAVYRRMFFAIDQSSYKLAGTTLPDPTNGFGFKAGIGVSVVKPDLLAAIANLSMNFYSGGGLRNIAVDGMMYMLGDKLETAIVKGLVHFNYDFKEKTLDLNANVDASLAGVITGHAPLQLHTDPNSWHLYLGTDSDPSNLNFAGLARAQSYFMVGKLPSAILRPLDPEITTRFDILQSPVTAGDNTETLMEGNGLAFAVALGVNCGFSKFIYAEVNFKGGLDALVLRRPGMVCGNSNYRANGKVYVYLDLGAGVKFRKKKFEVIEIGAGAILEGEFPKPIYASGMVDFRYKLLGGIISGNASAKFSTGSRCSWGPNGQSVYTPETKFDLMEEDEEELKRQIEANQEAFDQYMKEMEEENANSGAESGN